MHFFSLEFAYGTVCKDPRPHPANLGTEIETHVEAVEQARHDDSSKLIQSPFS